MYQVFIDMADHLKWRLNVMFHNFGSSKISEWKDEEIVSLFKYLNTIFTSEYSVTRCVKTFSMFLCTYKPDITWLDEIAETFKGTAVAYSNYITFSLNLPLRVRETLGDDHELLKFFQESLRQICYTMGITTYRLIRCDNEDESEGLK